MKGLFIVCEGLDAAGKTITIKEAIKKLSKNHLYNKGLKSDTLIGRITPKIPSTFTFLLELVYNTHRKIKPALKKDKIVLQDRYDLSVSSHVPNTDKWHNKLLISFFKRFLLKPDVLFYFTVSQKGRIRRLKKQKEHNKYHSLLIKNSTLIKLREKRYNELYKRFDGTKYKIDTTRKSVAATTNEFIAKLSKPRAQQRKSANAEFAGKERIKKHKNGNVNKRFNRKIKKIKEKGFLTF